MMLQLTEESLLNSPFTVVAVDPGLSGAVAVLGKGRLDVLRDFKSPPDIAQAVKRLTLGQPMPHLAVIEAVHAFPGQGVVSVWSFAEATGYAKCALCLCLPSVRAVEVAPQTWQRFFRIEGLASGEFDSRAIALSLFPSYSSLFKRKKDHNSADAVLLAVWGMVQATAPSLVERQKV